MLMQLCAVGLCMLYQLRKVTLPPETEASLIRRVVRSEEQRSAINVRKQESINAQTVVNTGAQRALTTRVVVRRSHRPCHDMHPTPQ